MDANSHKWLEDFKRINGVTNTPGRLDNIQSPLPITSHRARKPHRLKVLIDLTRVDLLLGRRRRDPHRT